MTRPVSIDRLRFAFSCLYMMRSYIVLTTTASHKKINNIQSFPFFYFLTLYFPASGKAVVTAVIPSSSRFLPSVFIAHRVQQFRCSSISHRVLLTHTISLSASQFMPKKKSQQIYTSMHSAGLDLTNLTYTRLEDNLIL